MAAMDSIKIPKTQKEINASRVSCVLSTLRGSVPYSRDFGIDTDIDAAAPAEAQRAFALAVQAVETYVPGVRCSYGRAYAGIDGKTVIKIKFEDV